MPVQISLLLGDCVARMTQLEEGSVGEVLCDPPYGIEFMGKTWDKLDNTDWQAGGGFSKPGIGERETAWPSYNAATPFGAANPTCTTCGGRRRGAKKCSCEKPVWVVKGEPVPEVSATVRQMQEQQVWHRRWFGEALRVLTPGGTIKAFSGTRTFHRMAAAMAEAGFMNIHLTAWGYGSGFPKSHNVAVYLDRLLTEGQSREVIRKRGLGDMNGKFADSFAGFVSQSKKHEVTSSEALPWVGWGTALKPAWEPVLVGHKAWSLG